MYVGTVAKAPIYDKANGTIEDNLLVSGFLSDQRVPAIYTLGCKLFSIQVWHMQLFDHCKSHNRRASTSI